MPICGIYKITSPSGKIYIGQSINVNERKSEYRNLRCKQQFRLYYSLKKYGFENHTFEVIHVCSPTELNDLEIYYISLYNTFGTDHGLNLRSGGMGGGKLSIETKEKIKAKRKLQVITDEHKEKIRVGNKGKYVSEETRAKLRKNMLGRKMPEEQRIRMKGRKMPEITLETREKLRKAHLGRKRPKQTGIKISLALKGKYTLGNRKTSKPILQKDFQGNIINTFSCAVEAKMLSGLPIHSPSKINMCCNGKRKSAYGYIWEFKTKENQ